MITFICRGSFAVVHKAIKKDTNEEFAVKIFDKYAILLNSLVYQKYLSSFKEQGLAKKNKKLLKRSVKSWPM